LRARFAFVDQHLSTREYLSGKDYSIADVGLYAMTDWTPRVGFDVHAYSNLVAHHAGSPIATLYVKFIGSRGLSRHDPWTVRFGYQASRGRFVRPCDPSRRSRDCRKGRYRTVTGPPAKSGRQPPMRRSVRSSRSQVIRPDRFGGRCVIDSATAEQCPPSSAVARQFLHF
jgi:Glutathione S-transferase, C-terminal domain